MYLIFDTETTGLPKKWGAPVSDLDNWPRCVQIAWQLHDGLGTCIEHQDFLIKPKDFNEWNKTIKTLNKKYKEVIVLKKK